MNGPPKIFLVSVLENLSKISRTGARRYIVQILDRLDHDISYHGHWI